MPDPTVGLCHWLQQDPAARGELVVAAWPAKGSVSRYLAGIHDERLRDVVRDLTRGEVTDAAGDGRFARPRLPTSRSRAAARHEKREV